MLLLNKLQVLLRILKDLILQIKVNNYNEFYKNTNLRYNKKLRWVDETSGTCQYSTEIGFKSFKPFASTSSPPLSPGRRHLLLLPASGLGELSFPLRRPEFGGEGSLLLGERKTREMRSGFCERGVREKRAGFLHVRHAPLPVLRHFHGNQRRSGP